MPCGNDPMTPHSCEHLTWLRAKNSNTSDLFKRGQTKPNRLSLTENCALVIKNVTVEDAASYTCRRLADNHDYAQLYMSVVKSKH